MGKNSTRHRVVLIVQASFPAVTHFICFGARAHKNAQTSHAASERARCDLKVQRVFIIMSRPQSRLAITLSIMFLFYSHINPYVLL